MEIAKATVEKILDTLSDDDFFNVLKVRYSPTVFIDKSRVLRYTCIYIKGWRCERPPDFCCFANDYRFYKRFDGGAVFPVTCDISV